MRIVGKSQPIHDAKIKVTGQAIYAGDMVLPGMLHAAVYFSNIPHGIVKSIDVSKALAQAGVVDVIHCFNTTQRMFNRFKTIKGQEVKEQEQVFSRHVRFVGDRIACVIAETAQIARKAVRLIEVEYEEYPFTTDVQEALDGKINQIHQEGAVYGDFIVELGKKENISDDMDIHLTSTSHLARISHIAMEPHACVASYVEGLEELTVWSPNQAVHGIRTVMAELFELPSEKVRIIKTTMGGSFGSKQEWVLEPVTIAATLKVGRPVKLVFDRGEVMVSTISRCPIDAVLTSDISKDGKIKNLSVDVTLDAGAYLGNSYDYIAAISSKFFRCYKLGYLYYSARAVCTNTPVSGAFRGWSGPEAYIMLEHHLNIAANRLNIDPVDLRLQNVAMPDDIDPKSGKSLGAIRFKESIELGRDKFQWQERKQEIHKFNNNSRRFKRGIGIGCGGHVNGYYPRLQDFAGVDMRITESGGVIVNITLHDHGCGTVTAFQMIVAEVMGLSVDKIYIREGDTAYSPLDVGCFASRTTYVLGRAAKDCAEKLKQRLIDGIAEVHQTNPKEIEIAGTVVRSKKDPSIAYSYGDAATKIFRELQKEVWVTHQYLNPSNPGVTGAHFALVEVDIYTGMVEILDYLAVHDIGQAINREMCIAQIQGAVMMGSGAALTEHLHVNPSNGRPISSMKDYHLINIPEAPNIQVELIEDGQTDGPYGAKSIGEVCHVPVAPAIIGAVNDALQSELCNLPLNPDTILKYLQKGRTPQ